jgi:hypothetical protein
MWLITQHGFYSIVQKEPGTFHVRARERRDLDNLIRRVPLPDAKIIETPKADYRFRILLGADGLAAVMSFLVNTVDYDNFKGRVGQTLDQAHKPYHEVWNILADSLGAYGKPGSAKRSG